MRHEAKGKCSDMGSSKTTSGSPLGEGSGSSRGRPASRIIAIFGETLEGGASVHLLFVLFISKMVLSIAL